MPVYSETAPNSNPTSRALGRILSEGRFTAQEIAEELGCSDRHIQHVTVGQGHLNDEKAARLSRWLCENGETRYAAQFLCGRYTIVPLIFGTANGSMKDEIVQLVKAGAMLDEGMCQRSTEVLTQARDLLRSALADVDAEIAQLKL